MKQTETIQETMANAMHLANVMAARKGDVIQWLNYLDIWQSARVEVPYNPGYRTIVVRRFPPEDSEGLPNTDTITLCPHEHPGRIRIVE